MVREILIWPHHLLMRKGETIQQFDITIHQLFQDLEETMLAANGAGLAAIQVGYALRALVLKVKKEDGSFDVLKVANPRVLERSSNLVPAPEGCLSLPGFSETMRRAEKIKIEAFDENGERFEIEADGVLSRAIQHEMDHLDGVMMVDRLKPVARREVRQRFAKAKARGMRYVPEQPQPQDFTKGA